MKKKMKIRIKDEKHFSFVKHVITALELDSCLLVDDSTVMFIVCGSDVDHFNINEYPEYELKTVIHDEKIIHEFVEVETKRKDKHKSINLREEGIKELHDIMLELGNWKNGSDLIGIRERINSAQEKIRNADINGSANILRKAFPNFKCNDGIEAFIVKPKRLNLFNP